MPRTARFLNSPDDPRRDLRGVLVPRVVHGHDHEIGQVGGDPAEGGAVERIAPPPMPEDRYQAARAERPGGGEDVFQSLGGMGEIDEAAGAVRQGMPLEASGDLRDRGGPADHGLVLHPPPQGRHRRQHVPDVEVPHEGALQTQVREAAHRHRHGGPLQAGPELRHAREGVGGKGKPPHILGKILQQPTPVRVVRVGGPLESGPCVARKQEPLGLEIVLHVLVEIQMFGVQVRKERNVEAASPQSPQKEPVGGGLHHAGAASVPDHLRKPALYDAALGGRPVRIPFLHPVALHDRAQKPRAYPGGIQDAAQDVGRRALAVRPRDPHHQQLLRRIPVYGGGDLAHDLAHGRDHDGRKPGVDGPLAEQGRGPKLPGHGNVVVPVAPLAPNAAEQGPRTNAPAVGHDVRYPGVLPGPLGLPKEAHLPNELNQAGKIHTHDRSFFPGA